MPWKLRRFSSFLRRRQIRLGGGQMFNFSFVLVFSFFSLSFQGQWCKTRRKVFEILRNQKLQSARIIYLVSFKSLTAIFWFKMYINGFFSFPLGPWAPSENQNLALFNAKCRLLLPTCYQYRRLLRFKTAANAITKCIASIPCNHPKLATKSHSGTPPPMGKWAIRFFFAFCRLTFGVPALPTNCCCCCCCCCWCSNCCCTATPLPLLLLPSLQYWGKTRLVR